MRLRSIIILLFVILGLAFVVLFWALQKPLFWEYAIGQALKNNPSIKIKELHIGGVKADWDRVLLSEVSGSFNANGQDIDIKRLEAHIFIWQKQARVWARTLIVDKYEFSDIIFPVNEDHGTWIIRNWQAILANGFLNGNMRIEPTMQVQAVVNVKGLDTKVLAAVNPDVFGQLKAVVDGHLTMGADARGLVSINGRFDAVNGGKMSPQLLGYLAQYLPQKDVLNDLIAKNADIPLNEGYVTILSLSVEQIRMHVKILSKAVNLDLNLDMDINLDGGLSAAAQALNHVLKGN